MFGGTPSSTSQVAYERRRQTIETIRSIYRWRGEVRDAREARVALRTRTDLVETIGQRVRDEHPYEVPSVVAVPIIDGNPDYLDRIRIETRTEP